MPAIADGRASPAEIRMIDKKSLFREREVFTPEMREAMDRFYGRIDMDLDRNVRRLLKREVRRG